MSDWIEHDEAIAEKAYEIWLDEGMQGHDVIGVGEIAARLAREASQHLIDAARIEGIRLGLEAAAEITDHDWPDPNSAIRRLDPEDIAREAKPPA